MLEKNVYDTKHVFNSQGGTRKPTNYSREHGNMPNKQGDQKLDHLFPQVVSFGGQRWTFDSCLIMQSKSRM